MHEVETAFSSCHCSFLLLGDDVRYQQRHASSPSLANGGAGT